MSEELRILKLMDEVKRGEHKKDILKNSSLKFKNDAQAMYFVDARYCMKTDTAYEIMNYKHQVADLKILKGLMKHV